VRRMLLVYYTIFMMISLVGGAQAEPQEAEVCSHIIASAHPDYPPYHWQENGKIVGASVDLTRQILAERGITLDARYQGPWRRVLYQAENGAVDLVLGLKQTKAREAFLTFSAHPIFENPFAVFVREREKFPFETWDDLRGRVGGKNAGDRYGMAFDAYAAVYLDLTPAKSMRLNFKKLQRGRLEYFIHGRYVGLAYLESLAEDMGIQPLDSPINTGVIHSGFTKDSPCLIHKAYLSKRYQEFMADGTATKVLHGNIQRWAALQKRLTAQ